MANHPDPIQNPTHPPHRSGDLTWSDLREGYPLLVRETFALRAQLESEEAHSAYLTDRVEKLKAQVVLMQTRHAVEESELLRLLEVAKAAPRDEARFLRSDLSDMRAALRDALTKLDANACLDCDATGGEPIESPVYSRDRMEITRYEVIGYADPDDQPCEYCAGAGRVA